MRRGSEADGRYRRTGPIQQRCTNMALDANRGLPPKSRIAPGAVVCAVLFQVQGNEFAQGRH